MRSRSKVGIMAERYTYWIGRSASPGWTWVRASGRFEGFDYVGHTYRRDPRRVAAVWAATLAVFGLIVYGCIS